jgi:outer membrane protein assembly factor BamE
MRKYPFIYFLIALLPILSSCAYRPDIQQGNVLETEQLQKIKLGMTKKQVSFLLGSPLLQDPFHRDRWDYIYTLKKANEPLIRQRLTLFFANEVLSKIDDSEFDKKIANP